MSVAVMLPTYCEAENIESSIHEIQELKLDLTIAVIDDSSPDETADITRKLQKKYGNIHLISRPEKLGLGTAITTGFRHMLKLTRVPDYIVTMDADYSHNPQDIPRLVEVANRGYDLVVGSRYSRGGRVMESRLRRRFISWIANLVAAITIGTKMHDTCMHRLKDTPSRLKACNLMVFERCSDMFKSHEIEKKQTARARAKQSEGFIFSMCQHVGTNLQYKMKNS